jgi:TetR/AcrR family fatty acid metabolism transcriptional regulator
MNKKEKILEAAISVFSSVGFHNAKISEIAEKAGIATGTTYLYFKSKEILLEEVFIKSWSNISDCLVDLSTKKKLNSNDKLKQLVDTISILIYKNKEIAKMILFEERFWNDNASEKVDEMVNNTKSMLSSIIQAGIKTGEYRKSVNPQLATTYIIGGLWYLMAYWAENFEQYKLETIKKEAYKLIIKGLE